MNKKNPLSVSMILLMAFLFINLAFPKAGTKIGNFPLYISVFLSYLGVLPLLIFQYLKKWKNGSDRMVAWYYAALAASFLLGAVACLALRNWQMPAMEYLLAYAVALGSLVFMLVFRHYSPDELRLDRIIIAAFIIVTLYGFIQKLFGDVKTIIPGLTMNYDDYIHVKHWWNKSNYILSLQYIKLSSTFQNGNLFGVNYIMITWFTLYFLNRIRGKAGRVVFYLALAAYVAICALTLSGTVYVGLIASLVLFYAFQLKKLVTGGNKFNPGKLAAGILVPAGIVVVAVVAVLFIPQLEFIRKAFDQRLLGRDLIGNERIKNFIPYLQYVWEHKNIAEFLFGSLFDAKRTGFSYEILLMTVFYNSGILFTGFFAWMVWRTARKWKFGMHTIGMYTYLLVSFIDGAFWLPPTPVLFFTLAGAAVALTERDKVSGTKT